MITHAWQKQSAWLWLLSPLSALYGAVSLGRKYAYQLGWLNSYHAPVPVWIVGNITVGGAGKTPLIIELVRYLQQNAVAVAVISRGYGRVLVGGDADTPRLVYEHSTPQEVGDEPCLIVKHTQVPMAVGSNRQKAIELLLQTYPDTCVIVSDDGLQHYALHRDIEWIVVDADRGFGNQKLLPQGFLREPITRLKNASVIWHEKTQSKRLSMSLVPGQLLSLLGQMPPPKQGKVFALSGIGYPKRFFDTVSDLGFEVVPVAFADHHRFELADLLPYHTHPIIVTSKDAVKLSELAKHTSHSIFENIWILPVKTVFSQDVYEMIDDIIHRFGMYCEHTA